MVRFSSSVSSVDTVSTPTPSRAAARPFVAPGPAVLPLHELPCDLLHELSRSGGRATYRGRVAGRDGPRYSFTCTLDIDSTRALLLLLLLLIRYTSVPCTHPMGQALLALNFFYHLSHHSLLHIILLPKSFAIITSRIHTSACACSDRSEYAAFNPSLESLCHGRRCTRDIDFLL